MWNQMKHICYKRTNNTTVVDSYISCCRNSFLMLFSLHSEMKIPSKLTMLSIPFFTFIFIFSHYIFVSQRVSRSSSHVLKIHLQKLLNRQDCFKQLLETFKIEARCPFDELNPYLKRQTFMSTFFRALEQYFFLLRDRSFILKNVLFRVVNRWTCPNWDSSKCVYWRPKISACKHRYVLTFFLLYARTNPRRSFLLIKDEI